MYKLINIPIKIMDPKTSQQVFGSICGATANSEYHEVQMIGAIIDTSGSVSREQLEDFLSEVKDIVSMVD